MTERIPCKTPGCTGTILPATAQRTGGFCMPCVRTAARKEREEYIRQNRREVNEFEGVTDPVEVLKIIHRPRTIDPLVHWIPYPTPEDQLYTGLDEREQRQLAEYAESLVGDDRNGEAEQIVLCLAAFTQAPLAKCLEALVAQGSFIPSLAFRRATSELRDRLIERVELDEGNRDHILLALAWIGDQAVVDLFARWRQRPPDWRTSLYLPPQDYSREAGWELDEDGYRRDLYFQSCTRLLRGPSDAPELFQAVIPSQDSCPWCRQQLTHLVQLVPAGLGLNGPFAERERVQVTTCEVCSVFAFVFGEFDRAGHGKWSPLNQRPEQLPDDADDWRRLPEDSLQLAGQRPALFAASQFLPTTFSQVGGHPTWIQDATYPTCPKCGRTMMFLAQVSRDDVEDSAEGVYYLFVCPGCRMTATTYQQT
ncbi:MAG: hypothetical protein QOH06_5821 [Acidobacteriota bacterium]|jgi:hypothetical protein|nr:hypothetical protein [Acidobacteriota bacterium]